MKKITVNFNETEVAQILNDINMSNAQHSLLVEMFVQSQNFASSFIKATLGIDVCSINKLIGRTGNFITKRCYSKKDSSWVSCNETVKARVISVDIISGMISIEKQSVGIDQSGTLKISEGLDDRESILPTDIDLDPVLAH